jgi:predicted amidohydrolase
MQALLAQLAPAPGDPSANVTTVAGILDDHPQADLAVFPELFVSGYDPTTAASVALAPDDRAFWPIAHAARARRTAVMVGFAERLSDGVANSVACIGPDGSYAGCYRKTHLFGPEERDFFVAGDHLLVTDLGGVSVGPLVCFDTEFPEPARVLCRGGAAMLVTVAANMEPYGPDHELSARARALENRRPHIYVNRVGEQAGHRFVGGSLVAGPSGEIVAALGGESGVLCVEVDPYASVPSDLDYLSHVRSDLPVRSPAFAHIQGGSR